MLLNYKHFNNFTYLRTLNDATKFPYSTLQFLGFQKTQVAHIEGGRENLGGLLPLGGLRKRLGCERSE